MVLVALDPSADGFRATLASGGTSRRFFATAREAVRCTPRGLLGVLDAVAVGDVELSLTPGDVLVLCTDGVTEARRTDGRGSGSSPSPGPTLRTTSPSSSSSCG